MLLYIGLNHITLYDIALHGTIYYIISHDYTTLCHMIILLIYCIILYCIILCYVDYVSTALLCIVLYCIVWYNTIFFVAILILYIYILFVSITVIALLGPGCNEPDKFSIVDVRSCKYTTSRHV